MAEQAPLYVVTKNGVKASDPLPLAEANQKASELKALLESQGGIAPVIGVVPVLLG